MRKKIIFHFKMNKTNIQILEKNKKDKEIKFYIFKEKSILKIKRRKS